VRERLEQVYQDHRQGLFSLALAISRSVDLAEEAVQEAFVRLWRSRRQPSGDPVSYVFAAVRNAAIELSRRRRPTSAIRVSLFDGTEADPAASAIAAERQQVVRDAVDRLPLRQRQAVVMRLYGGLSFQQIAEVLDEPLQTVASRYRRALERIKQAVEGKL
jgi:RNA polymerase sigma-70 factor (ECF subfamily)